MAPNVLSIVELADVDPAQHHLPDLDDAGRLIAQSGDGHITRIPVTRIGYAIGGIKNLQRIDDVDATLHITDARVVVTSTKYDKGWRTTHAALWTGW
jgi:hypothetical protein